MISASTNVLELTQGKNTVVALKNVPNARVAFAATLTGSAGVKLVNVVTIAKATEEIAQRKTATKVTANRTKEIFKTKYE